jgi:hypothetical protein
MVDNTLLNLGTGGDTVASDDIAGIKFQRVKLIHGADGVNAGDVATGNPLPTVQTGALPAGTNNIGDVDVLTQPPLSHATDSVRIGDGTDLALVSAAGALLVDGAAVTQPVSAASLPLPAGAATAALQTQPGVDVGDVTVNNAAGASAVNVQDGGNSITVDGTVSANLNAGANNIGDVDVLSGPTGASALQHQGEVAHDGVDANNPTKIGGQARQTNPAAVADLDRTNAIFDDVGRQIVVLNHARDLVTKNKITLSSTTETTLLAAGAAGVFHDLTLLVITNSSATAVRVDIRDATAGTTVMEIAIAANGGAVIPFSTPLPQAAAANNWTAQLSGAVTDVRIFVQAVKNV